jgi:hypothetical protein
MRIWSNILEIQIGDTILKKLIIYNFNIRIKKTIIYIILYIKNITNNIVKNKFKYKLLIILNFRIIFSTFLV